MPKSKELADVLAKDFVIFKSGTWNGETFTDADLDGMVASFDAAEPPHIIAGHSSDYKGKTLIPSFGRVTGGLKRVGNELFAVGTQFAEVMAQWIKDGFYNQRSIEVTKDNKRILAIGMLGVAPPAVKRMPLMQLALKDTALAMSEFSESKAIDFVEDEVPENKIKELSEACGRFIEVVGAENESELAVAKILEFQEEIMEILNITPFGNQHETKWKEFTNRIKQLFINQEDKEMDDKREKELTEKIAAQEVLLKEFADKEVLAADQKKLADQAAKDEALKVADIQLRTDVKKFCADNKLDTKKHQELKIEEILFATAKANQTIEFAGKDKDGKDILEKKSLLSVLQDAVKLFTLPVPAGSMDKEFAEDVNDKRTDIVKKAEKYIKAHPKEFADLKPEDAINRALNLEAIGKIEFEK
jgi:hypothetical protein